jgi:hypothetical protein
MKQDHNCICFEEFLNKNSFESIFQFSAAFSILLNAIMWPSTPPPSDAVGGNPDDLLSLSLSL